jgi:hypothetical protein
MDGHGWINGGPLELGGDTTKTEDVYNALRAAVGIGGPRRCHLVVPTRAGKLNHA